MLQARYAELLLEVSEKEASHRQQLAAQMDVIEALRGQEAKAQLSAAQYSTELGRLKSQLNLVHHEARLKETAMKEVDCRLFKLEQTVSLPASPVKAEHCNSLALSTASHITAKPTDTFTSEGGNT